MSSDGPIQKYIDELEQRGCDFDYIMYQTLIYSQYLDKENDVYCGDCKQECRVVKYDDSFDHEFGTEHLYHYGSDCCDSEVFDYICHECNGTGIIEIETCDECGGLGLNGKLGEYDLELANEGW